MSKSLFVGLRAIFSAALTFGLSPTIALAQNPNSMTPESNVLLTTIESAMIHHESSAVWKPENGPWAAYLEKPFKEGLSERERALYEEALNAGDCETVKSLQLTGFLLLHPTLRAAHARMFISEIFSKTVIRKSVEFGLCTYRMGIFSALLEIKSQNLEHLLPIKIDGRTRSAYQVVGKNEPGHAAFGRLCTSLSALARMAINDEYVPAITDVLKYLDEDRLLKLPPEQEYYFYHRAIQLGLLTDLPSDGRLDIAYHNIPSKKRMKIERYLMERKGTNPVHGGWVCSSGL